VQNEPGPYVVINAITVPAAHADELAARFAGRAGMVESADGFMRFELLRPADGREQWLVMTTWRDQAAFEAWRSSASFGQAHAGDRSAPPGGHPGGEGHGGGPPPVATTSEVWAYTVEQQAEARS
jgi:heme-degrading monooxygenase HmoA